MGFGTLFLYISLNKYLLYSKRYSYIPNSLLNSMRTVLEGILGFAPCLIGVSVFTTIQLF